MNIEARKVSRVAGFLLVKKSGLVLSAGEGRESTHFTFKYFTQRKKRRRSKRVMAKKKESLLLLTNHHFHFLASFLVQGFLMLLPSCCSPQPLALRTFTNFLFRLFSKSRPPISYFLSVSVLPTASPPSPSSSTTLPACGHGGGPALLASPPTNAG